MKKYFWHMMTVFFVLLWFVVIPYLSSGTVVDLTIPSISEVLK